MLPTKYSGGLGKGRKLGPQDAPNAPLRGPSSSAPKPTMSEHTMPPNFMEGIRDSKHGGADVLLPKPDYYSNPNPNEHVTGWPTKNKSEVQHTMKKYMLYIGLALGMTAILTMSR